MIFLDASALVAMLTNEIGARELLARLDKEPDRITSPVAVYEASLAVARILNVGLAAARSFPGRFMREVRITVVPIQPEDADGALDAFARYGRGQGHPAKLNTGDCFAYAVAMRTRAEMLFVGNDFVHTDVIRTPS